MSGRKSRIKGKVWERKVASLFREVMPGACIKRGYQYRSGVESPDVDMPVFWPECKHHNRTNIKAALKQAEDDAPKGRVPIAVCKDDNQKPIVAMYLEDFLEFVEQWWCGMKQ